MQCLSSFPGFPRGLVGFPIDILRHVKVDLVDDQVILDDRMGGRESNKADLVGVAEDQQVLPLLSVWIQVVQWSVIPTRYESDWVLS